MWQIKIWSRILYTALFHGEPFLCPSLKTRESDKELKKRIFVIGVLVVRVNLANAALFVPAYRGSSSRSAEHGFISDDDDSEEATSTVDPRSGSVTERSNTSKNNKSSQILYLITSSPKKSDKEMPGQWLGRGRTAAHNTSMYTLILGQPCHYHSVFWCHV